MVVCILIVFSVWFSFQLHCKKGRQPAHTCYIHYSEQHNDYKQTNGKVTPGYRSFLSICLRIFLRCFCLFILLPGFSWFVFDWFLFLLFLLLPRILCHMKEIGRAHV